MDNKKYEINIDDNGFSKNVKFNLLSNIDLNFEEEQDSTKKTQNNSSENQEEKNTNEAGNNNDDGEDNNNNDVGGDNNIDDTVKFNSNRIEPESDDNSNLIKSYKNDLGILIIVLLFIMSLLD